MYRIEVSDGYGHWWEAHAPVDDLENAKRLAKMLVHPDWDTARTIEVVDDTGKVVAAFHRNMKGDAVPA